MSVTENKMTLPNAIIDDPKQGACGTIGSFIVGMLPQIDPVLQNNIIFWLQVIAFTISIAVGILTIIGYIKKLRKRC